MRELIANRGLSDVGILSAPVGIGDLRYLEQGLADHIERFLDLLERIDWLAATYLRTGTELDL